MHGIAGPFVAGHYGFHGGEYSTRARHTLRHGSILPANTPGWAAPVPSSLYLHHPILTHQVVTLTFGLFGEHPATVRLGSLLGCLLTMLALWWILLQRWGPLPAGLGAVTFALLPINVWFAPHMDVGYPSMVCALLCFERYLPWIERGRYRDLGLCLLWAALSVGFEWSPYLFAIPLGLLRNAARITVLGWLSVNVDEKVIHGPLHHHGGPIFFALSLVPLFGLLWYFRWSESSKSAVKNSTRENS